METNTEAEVYLLLLGGVGVALFLAMGVVLSLAQYQRRVMLKNQQLLQIQNAYQRDLLQATLVSEEQARARIARDLHDEVGATLSTTKLYLSQLHEAHEIVHSQEMAARATELVSRTIQNIRLISKDLSPAVLTTLGLFAAVQELFAQVSASQVIEAHCTCEETIPRFDEVKELMVYRIVQELTNNSLKHAQAKHLSLALRYVAPHTLFVSYSDDGKGFRMEEKKKGMSGIGLKNIDSRAEILGGKMSFTSKENKGVQFEMEVTV